MLIALLYRDTMGFLTCTWIARRGRGVIMNLISQILSWFACFLLHELFLPVSCYNMHTSPCFSPSCRPPIHSDHIHTCYNSLRDEPVMLAGDYSRIVSFPSMFRFSQTLSHSMSQRIRSTCRILGNSYYPSQSVFEECGFIISQKVKSVKVG